MGVTCNVAIWAPKGTRTEPTASKVLGERFISFFSFYYVEMMELTAIYGAIYQIILIIVITLVMNSITMILCLITTM